MSGFVDFPAVYKDGAGEHECASFLARVGKPTFHQQFIDPLPAD
jgi:hypothetical protein